MVPRLYEFQFRTRLTARFHLFRVLIARCSRKFDDYSLYFSHFSLVAFLFGFLLLIHLWSSKGNTSCYILWFQFLFVYCSLFYHIQLFFTSLYLALNEMINKLVYRRNKHFSFLLGVACIQKRMSDYPFWLTKRHDVIRI